MSVSTSIDLSTPVAPVNSPGSGLSQSASGGGSPTSILAAGENAPAAAAPKAQAPPSAAEVTVAAKQIATFLSSSKTDIGFALDQSSGQMVVRITDASTGKVIRQIPSEVVLQIAQELKQNRTVDSLQFDEKA